MKDIMKVLDNLTCNNQYATDVCLLLFLDEQYTSLYYLDYLGIKGKELETLAHKCCKEFSVDWLYQTIRFLRSGYLGIDEIKENLNSKKPILFINRLLRRNENYELAYENYAGDFRYLLSKNKKR